jgi:hypothetical protein
MVVSLYAVVEIISNRHFYDVFGDFTVNPVTAWYRSRLIDVALFEGGMSDCFQSVEVAQDEGFG